MVEYSPLTASSGHSVLGGKAAIATFVCMLLAFVAEGQLTQVGAVF